MVTSSSQTKALGFMLGPYMLSISSRGPFIFLRDLCGWAYLGRLLLLRTVLRGPRWGKPSSPCSWGMNKRISQQIRGWDYSDCSDVIKLNTTDGKDVAGRLHVTPNPPRHHTWLYTHGKLILLLISSSIPKFAWFTSAQRDFHIKIRRYGTQHCTALIVHRS